MNKSAIIAVLMVAIMLAATLLPQAWATNASTSNAVTLKTIKGVNVCPKNTGIKLADLDKAFLDPRAHPKNGGYTGSNTGSVQVIGLINKAMGQTSFPTPLTTTSVAITIAAVPGGTFALVDDFLPAGFNFANPTAAGFLDNGAPANVVLLFDGFVRIRCSTPGIHTITFNVVSPKWGVSFFSQDFARVFYINGFGQVFGFDFVNLTVFVQGTGSFIMANALVTKPNYKPQMPRAICSAK